MTQRTRTRLSEEARFEMTLAAASRERSNRPLGLVVVACVFLAGTLIFAGSSIASRASARSRLRAELLSQAGAEAKVQEWKRLAQAAADSPQGAIGKPGEFKVSRMEELATRAGLKSRPNAPVSRDDKSRQGIVVFTHVYTEVRDPSLANMVDWVRSACAEIAGLEVESLTVRPEPAGWKMDVTFRRWERAG